MYKSDYHVHTFFSHDCSCSPLEQIERAKKNGISELCFTDHIDFDKSLRIHPRPCADIKKLKEFIDDADINKDDIKLKFGAEISLDAFDAAARALHSICDIDTDFIIASVHLVDGIETYSDDYFRKKTKQTAYYDYLDMILRGIKTCGNYSVLGHYDFVTKYAPFKERAMTLNIAEEVFNEIFKIIIADGKGIEINTSAWWDDPLWGYDILKRYRLLGGEFITVGSDTHDSNKIGYRFDEALRLAVQSGIKYVATFEKLKPSFHEIQI